MTQETLLFSIFKIPIPQLDTIRETLSSHNIQFVQLDKEDDVDYIKLSDFDLEIGYDAHDDKIYYYSDNKDLKQSDIAEYLKCKDYGSYFIFDNLQFEKSNIYIINEKLMKIYNIFNENKINARVSRFGIIVGYLNILITDDLEIIRNEHCINYNDFMTLASKLQCMVGVEPKQYIQRKIYPSLYGHQEIVQEHKAAFYLYTFKWKGLQFVQYFNTAFISIQ